MRSKINFFKDIQNQNSDIQEDKEWARIPRDEVHVQIAL